LVPCRIFAQLVVKLGGLALGASYQLRLFVAGERKREIVLHDAAATEAFSNFGWLMVG
jgi:hypothetical protein